MDLLAKEIVSLLVKKEGDRPLSCLDVGCGDMVLAERIQSTLPNTDWKCIDIHPLPKELEEDEKWKKYTPFDGRHIPFADKSFDVLLFCDVLHHTGEDLAILLSEAARVSKSVIIKDHFEYGLYSRSMLQLMDIVGNWGYGVSIPSSYFTRKGFEQAIGQAGLKIDEMNIGIRLYDHLPFLGTILRPDWQFLTLLKA